MQIKILNVGATELKQGPKAKYSVFTLTYESNGRENKKSIMSFQKEIFGTLASANVGDVYDVEAVKNGQFWDWKSVTKATATSPATSGGSGGGYYKETSEERALRQVYIVRQSSLASAVTALGPGHGTGDYIAAARDFEGYVFGVDMVDEPNDEGVV